jgi:hypothetical protein
MGFMPAAVSPGVAALRGASADDGVATAESALIYAIQFGIRLRRRGVHSWRKNPVCHDRVPVRGRPKTVV